MTSAISLCYMSNMPSGDLDSGPDFGPTEAPKSRAADLYFGPTLRESAAKQRMFGRLVLHKILGRGETGVVWQARDGEPEIRTALKFPPQEIERYPEAVVNRRSAVGSSTVSSLPTPGAIQRLI